MRRSGLTILIAVCVGLVLLAGLAFTVPSIQRRIAWRADMAYTYVRVAMSDAGSLPTALPQPKISITRQPTATVDPAVTLAPTLAATVGPTPTPTVSPTPLPGSVTLTPPKWEKQDANNCGPASLALYLRHYGWEGDQFTISDVIKPFREDRNVNVDELVYFVRNKAGWLNIEYRVGGDLQTLKSLIAAGYPVMIEEGMTLDQKYWPTDDKWAAHYMLLTGYDDANKTFTGQDTYYGANKKFSYDSLDKSWEAFNRVYIMVYPPDQEPVIKSIIGPNWDVETNRQEALKTAQAATEAQPDDAYAWFNYGTNLAYFERYSEAAQAYDQARAIGLPQRMLRYQFGPFMSYFHSGELDQLDTLIKYAFKITPNSEETYLWHGWMEFRQGDKNAAIEDFRKAVQANPNYEDAKYALHYAGG